LDGSQRRQRQGLSPHQMVEIVRVTADNTHDLRRRVLRRGDPDARVIFDGDDDGPTVHLGAMCDHSLVGVASLFAHRPFSGRPTDTAVQLRGMAIEPAWQGRGIGGLLLAAVEDAARLGGASILWANARATAIGFYLGKGLALEGPEFFDSNTGLLHQHVWVML